ncbi:MAG: MBL fold metallo-hydrolase [Oscillospiraceae bacterium]
MSRMYRGTEIFQPLNTGWIDGHVACVREWVANIFFYRKDGTTIMMDAGYNYNRLAEKMAWLGIAPESIRHILITHQDTDHVGAVEEDSQARSGRRHSMSAGSRTAISPGRCAAVCSTSCISCRR